MSFLCEVFIVELMFNVDGAWFDISFNGRSVVELHAISLDVKKLCDCIEQKKSEISLKRDSALERLNRTCVVPYYDNDEDAKNEMRANFKDEKFYKQYDVFVIADAENFVDAEMVDIIKSHPEKYWLLCSYKLLDGLVSPYDICELRCEEGTHYWNVFTPCVPVTYRDLKFSFLQKDYHIDMGNHNVILIRGDAASGKSMMADALKHVSIFSRAFGNPDAAKDTYMYGSYESMFDWVCVEDLNNVRDFRLYVCSEHNEGFFEKVKTIVIDHSDLYLTPELERVIQEHPNHNWVLIGNYKPSFIPDDAVCTWKHEGHRYWNEFVSESENRGAEK